MMEFLAQGGYAFYIWSCYGLAVVLLAGEIVILRRRRRTILAHLGRLRRMHQTEVSHEG